MKPEIEIASVHGMCGGVFAALRALEKALAEGKDRPLYVLHELVHNRQVTEELRARGVRFIERREELPPGADLVIGAHGVPAETERMLRRIAGRITDATCPLVKKLQLSAAGLTKEDQLVLFGRRGHPEIEGVSGHSCAGENYLVSSLEEIDALPELKRPFFISQTTVDAAEGEKAERRMRERFPSLRSCGGVCDASRKRQQSVAEMAKRCPVILIVGSAHSSNACRLREIAERAGRRAYRIENHSEIPFEALRGVSRIGVSSGASTPESLVEEVLFALRKSLC